MKRSGNNLTVKKKTVKSDQFFSGDQYFSPKKNGEKWPIFIKTDQSKPVSDTVADQSKLVSYTDSDKEEEEHLHVDVNFDEPIGLVINNFLFLKQNFKGINKAFWFTCDV